MILIHDEFEEIWVWVENNNHNIDLSPRFDFREDALLWQTRMINILCKGKE
jgi:hypothetical protein